VLRGIALLNRRDVLIEDEIDCAKPAALWWFLHTTANVTAKGNRAELQLNGKKMFAQILSPANATFEIMKAEPLQGSPHPPMQAKNEGVTKLAIHLPHITNTRVAVLLSTQPNQQADVLPLERW
jgi:hypothetical protein